MMAEDNQFKIELRHVAGLEFRVKFDLENLDELPVGGGAGPSASRLLAAAAANCLSASLLYCVAKQSPPAGSLHASAVCRLIRDAQGRTRIGSIAVTIEVSSEIEQAVRLKRCLDLYEEFSLAAAGLRQGFPVSARVVNAQGETLHQNPDSDFQ
ncbi:MAG: OsmC family protein [Gammaproteobacteria bacterium]|nr:OsmC family protein [Gammaproteobacteria bacterium]